jgi:hypothetical protein
MARVRMSVADAEAQRFPRICVRTGEPSTTTVKLDAYRTPWWAYVLLLFGLIPGLLVIYAIRRHNPHAALELPVSTGVATRRRDRLALAGAAAIGGIALVLIGAFADSTLAVLCGIAMSAVALVVTALALDVLGVRAHVTRRDEVVLNHVHDAFAAAIEARR